MRDLRQEIDFNIQHAAELRIRGMHQVMLSWFRELGAEVWRELRVVIATSHMARQENLAEQYFEWLLDEHEAAPSRKRVIKVEGLEDEDSAVSFFGVHAVDSQAGEAFFKQPDYLHRDILAPPVSKILAMLNRP